MRACKVWLFLLNFFTPSRARARVKCFYIYLVKCNIVGRFLEKNLRFKIAIFPNF